MMEFCFISSREQMVDASFKTILAFYILVISLTSGIEAAVSCPTGDTAGIIKDGQTCSELILSANYECYDSTIETSCCSSCNGIAGSNADCIYGDRQSNCFDFACPSYVNISDCCETCATTTSTSAITSTSTTTSATGITSTSTSSLSTITSASTSATTTSSPVGAIVGGVVGGVAGVSLVTAGVIIALKLKKHKGNKIMNSETSLSDNPEKKKHVMNGPVIETNMLDEKVDSSLITDTKSIDESGAKDTTIMQTSAQPITQNPSTIQDERANVATDKFLTHNEPFNVITEEPPAHHETVNDVTNNDVSGVQSMKDTKNPQGNPTLFTKLPPIMLEPKLAWDY